MTRKTLLIVVGLMLVVGLTFGLATTASASPRAAVAYTITATAGANGSIDPAGAKQVAAGGSVVYTMQPAEGYQVDTISVDGTTVPKACWYTFLNVVADHTISVTFKVNPAGWFTVTPYAGEHGQIWMAQQTVQASDTAPPLVACSITADAGYHVETLVVDGMLRGQDTWYGLDLYVGPRLGFVNFYNVRAGHTIRATFAADEVAPVDTAAPVSTDNAAATYPTSPATVRLTSTDEVGGSGMAAIYYRIDGGTTVEVNPSGIRAAVGTPELGIPADHSPAAPTSCGCHATLIPATHSAGASPASCACHVIEKPTVAVDVPNSHAARVTGDCKGCHPAAGVIMPVSSSNPNHYGQTAGYIGAGECRACHTFNVLAPAAPPVSMNTDVVVSGAGAHTIEYWGKDVAGNVETPHKTVSFTIGSVDVATSIGIGANRTSAYTGQIVTLSGTVTPFSMVGNNVVVYVKKPGRTFYSYSSARTVYDLGGTAAWLYKYKFVAGMAKGTYTFKAVVPASTGFLTSSSGTVSVRLR